MSKIKLLSIGVIGLLLINLGIVGFLLFHKPTQLPAGPPPLSNDGPKNIIAERLHFDKGQVAEYEKLIHAHQSAIKNMEDSIRMAKDELYKTLTNEDESVKDSLVTELGLYQQTIEEIHYNHFMDIKKLCRPDQLDKFDKLTNELAHFFATGKNDSPPPKD